MKAFSTVLVLFLMIGCGQKQNQVIEDSNPAYAQARDSLRVTSSRILDTLAGGGRVMGEDSFNLAECGKSSGGVVKWEATHFWQIDRVPVVDIPQAISRLESDLISQGWEIIDLAFPPAVKNPVVRARDSQGYTVRALGVQDRNRIAVRVSAPCFTVVGRPS